MKTSLKATAATPLIVADGFVTVESSGRRASDVVVYGVDERFWTFHGLVPQDGVFISPTLASEVGAKEGDVLLTRLQKPSEIPVESLFGRKEDVGRTVRLTLTNVLPSDRLGEFSVKPQQAGVRAVFAPLRRIQRDLAVNGQVNTVLLAGGDRGETALRSALQLEDLGVRVTAIDNPPAVAVESTSGILSEPLESAIRGVAAGAGAQPVPIFTYLANTLRTGDRQIPYSLVTATDMSVVLDGSAPSRADAIVLNEWAARELDAKPGERIDLDYYLWDPVAGLMTRSASFTWSASSRLKDLRPIAVSRPIIPASPRRRVSPTGIRPSRSISLVCDPRTSAIGTSIGRRRRPSFRTRRGSRCGNRATGP